MSECQPSSAVAVGERRQMIVATSAKVACFLYSLACMQYPRPIHTIIKSHIHTLKFGFNSSTARSMPMARTLKIQGQVTRGISMNWNECSRSKLTPDLNPDPSSTIKLMGKHTQVCLSHRLSSPHEKPISVLPQQRLFFSTAIPSKSLQPLSKIKDTRQAIPVSLDS